MARKAAAFVLVLLLSVCGFTSLVASDCGTGQGREGSRAGHTPININGDSAFSVLAQNENWPGNGTSGNPYVIQDYTINGTGVGYCIRISSTNVYFVIRNCTFNDSTGGSGHPNGFSASVDLNTVKNGVVENCTMMRGSWCGVNVRSNCQWVRVVNCTIAGFGGNPAIYLAMGGSNHEISGNNVTSCYAGVYLDSMSYCRILNNTLSGNNVAIRLYFSNYINITNNTCSFCNEGIDLEMSSNFNIIHRNNCSSTNNVGIRLEAMMWMDIYTNNVITENNASSNGYVGIWGWAMGGPQRPNNNRYEGNRCDGNYYDGIRIEGEDNAKVLNNNCSKNGDRGIRISDTRWPVVNYNTCGGNMHGITTSYQQFGVTLTNNTCIGNSNHGISVDYYSDGSIISDNYCAKNGATGISLYYQTDGCVLFNNTVSGNYRGIEMVDNCHNNRVINCTVSKNVQGFNVASGITGTLVHSNNIINNGLQAADLGTNNRWNATYPLRGNYWSGYRGTDQYCGTYPQSTPGSDGFGDTRYSLEPADVHRDYYPLMLPAMNGLPNSTADPLPRYWYCKAAFVTATAKDDHEGVGSVTLYSNYSKNNSTWSAARTVGKDIEAPWSWGFDFQQGEGNYRFFTGCVDAVENPERPKSNYTEARCGFDATRPSVSILSPAQDQEFRTADVKLVWNGSDALSGLDHFELKLDGMNWVDVGKDTVRLLSGLPDRPHNAVIRAYDEAGNFNESFVDFKVDSGLPLLGIFSPVDGEALGYKDVTVEWYGEDLGMGISHFETLLDNGSWENVGMNMSRTYENLSEGLHLFSAQVFDVLGNNVSETISFYVDTGNPNLTIVSPAEGALLNGSTVTVLWRGQDNATSVAQYELSYGDAGWFGVGLDLSRDFYSLSEGEHHVEVRATDRSGNQETASVTFTVDTRAPVIVVYGPSGFVAATTATISWNCTDATTGVALMETRLDTGEWVDAGANTSRLLAGLTDGIHEFEVRAKDRVGNIATQKVKFTVDASPPLVRIASPAKDETIRSANFTASWTGSDATSGLALFEVRLDGGSWLKTGTGLIYNFNGIPDGGHTLEVRATDVVGNAQVANVSFTIDTKPQGPFDTTAPTVIATAPNGIGVKLVTAVVITFSEPIEPSSFKYTCSPDPGAWTILWNANFSQAVLLHADFAYKTVYSFTVSGAKDMAGNSLNGSSNFSFTTVKMTAAPKPVSSGVDASLLAIPIVLIIVLVVALLFVMSRGPKAPKATVEPAAVAPPPTPVAPVATVPAPEPEKAHKGKMRSKPGVVSPAASTPPAVAPPSKPDDIDIDDIDIDDEEEFKP